MDFDDLLDTINVFSKLEPIKALLFSNAIMPEDKLQGLVLSVLNFARVGLEKRGFGKYILGPLFNLIIISN